MDVSYWSVVVERGGEELKVDLCQFQGEQPYVSMYLSGKDGRWMSDVRRPVSEDAGLEIVYTMLNEYGGHLRSLY